MNKKKLDNFYNVFAKKLDQAEATMLPFVVKYYQNQFDLINKALLASGQINPALYFKQEQINKMYKDIYLYTGFFIGKWYAGYTLTQVKKNTAEQYAAEWELVYSQYAAQMSEMFGAEIARAATQNAINVFQQLIQDPAFATLGTEAKARILFNKTKQQSMVYARRIIATETNRIANMAIENSALSFYKAEDLRKFWIAGGANIRDTHIEANFRYGTNTDGIPMKDNFLVGQDSMPRPTSGSLAAENINCKCVMATLPVSGADSIGEDLEDIGFGTSFGYNPTGNYI